MKKYICHACGAIITPKKTPEKCINCGRIGTLCEIVPEDK